MAWVQAQEESLRRHRAMLVRAPSPSLAPKLTHTNSHCVKAGAECVFPAEPVKRGPKVRVVDLPLVAL